MTRFRARIAPAIIAVLLVAGCGEQSPSVTAPENASYDGGFTFGGGNRSADTTTTTTTSSGEGAVDSGGHTFGSGNGVLVGSGH
jgi:hypothetical protein